MTKEEVKIFERLPDAESRKEFIADFWLKRDPDPDTPDNDYRKEFEARVEFVNKRFNKEGGPGYNTDRGRVYILMGPPEKIEEFMPEVGSPVRGFAQWWSYYSRQMAVEFIDETGTGKFRMTRQEGDFWGAMDLMKLGRYVRADDVFSKKFVNVRGGLRRGRRRDRGPPSRPSGLMFRDNEEGRLQVDLRFLIYIYADGGAAKESFAAPADRDHGRRARHPEDGRYPVRPARSSPARASSTCSSWARKA
ncbi:MAG: GWxTD domain-containing protein [Rhodopseudomonas palustris]|nr:GWxTD domain-containing protein [Rhodopseudomonas palustris]